MRRVRILSGPVRSGKTTRLAAWADGRRDVAGLLSPDGPDGRRFVDLANGATEPMEAGPGEPALAVGRFRFRPDAFGWAATRLAEADEDPQVRSVVIDEVGPLELRGEGLAIPLRRLLGTGGAGLVLIVREGLVARVAEAFDIVDHEPWCP